MKITNIGTRLVPMRLREPFVITTQSIKFCEHIICHIETDEGIAGVSSVATIPAFMGETGSTIQAVIAFLAPLLAEMDPCNIERINELMDAAFSRELFYKGRDRSGLS
jgi:L-alanine-DL-glutamate epimerase-like enolase superfamily enzyme